jgi:ribonuclease J
MAREMGFAPERVVVIENGQVVEFESGRMTLGERIPGDYVFVDGAGVGDVGPAVVRERELLSREGFVMVNLVTDGISGKLAQQPEIVTRGFVYAPEAAELLASTSERISRAVERANGNLAQDVETAVRNFLYNETKRRPLVFVNVTQI